MFFIGIYNEPFNVVINITFPWLFRFFYFKVILGNLMIFL